MPTPLSKIPVVGPVADVATDLVAGVAKLPAAAADKAATQVRSGVTLGRLAVEGTARSLVSKVTGRSSTHEAPTRKPSPASAPAPAAPAAPSEPVTDIDAGAADVEVDVTPADIAALAGSKAAPTKSATKKSPAKKAAAKKSASKKAPAKKAPVEKPAPTKTPDEVPLKSEPTPASAAPPVPEGPEQLGQLGDDRTEPLLDPATAKQVASESETLQQGSES